MRTVLAALLIHWALITACTSIPPGHRGAEILHLEMEEVANPKPRPDTDEKLQGIQGTAPSAKLIDSNRRILVQIGSGKLVMTPMIHGRSSLRILMQTRLRGQEQFSPLLSAFEVRAVPDQSGDYLYEAFDSYESLQLPKLLRNRDVVAYKVQEGDLSEVSLLLSFVLSDGDHRFSFEVSGRATSSRVKSAQWQE